MSRAKYTQWEDIRNLTYEQKLQAQKQLSKRANVRMKQLEKNGITYYAYEMADHYLKGAGRNNHRFYEGKQFKNERLLNLQLLNLTSFLNAQSSTMKGIKQINKTRLEAFQRKGIEIKDAKSFFQFLGSKQFASLGRLVDSNQIIEDFAKAIDDGFTAEQIQQQYQDFMNSEMTFEQIAEKRKRTAKRKRLK